MLTVQVSTISNSHVFLLKKCEKFFANEKATHIFFSKNISVYAIFNDQSFNDALTTTLLALNKRALNYNKGYFQSNNRGPDQTVQP